MDVPAETAKDHLKYRKTQAELHCPRSGLQMMARGAR